MTPFRDLPIRRKLLLLTLAPTVTALLVAGAGFIAWDVVALRRDIRLEALAQARIIAENTAPAVDFNDERSARQNLHVLEIRPRIEAACVYGEDGRLFASYERTEGGGACPAGVVKDARVGWDRYEVLEPLFSGNDNVGTLYLVRDLQDVTDRLRFGTLTVLVLLALAVVAASAIARGMQRSIASPMLELADIASRISKTRDYSLRATARTSADEIGVVVNAFNHMLERIGQRTAELSRANTDLEREIEERRRVERERTAALERERDANRLKDEFLATLSHELRTPLNAVLGWTRVLRAAPVDAATSQRALESIERNARAQTRLIEDLLEVSRIVTGKLRLNMRAIDLAEIIEAAVEIVQPAAAAKRLRLEVDLAARPAPTAGDPDRLQQVIWNLLSNAVKFTPPEGQVTVRLDRNADYHITVTDSGAGIEPRFLPFVFDAFRQADGTPSREHGGLGLGLAIAKQLVELHGGTIEAHSDGHGRGATFGVRLPLTVAERSACSPPLASVTALDADAPEPDLLRGVRILVVDDEHDARVLMATALMQYGASVVEAASVAEALDAFDRVHPALVVSDIGMPREDGYALIGKLRARTADAGGAVPAIAVTAYASDHDRAATSAAGYQAHIVKPFEPADVARLAARLAHAAAKP